MKTELLHFFVGAHVNRLLGRKCVVENTFLYYFSVCLPAWNSAYRKRKVTVSYVRHLRKVLLLLVLPPLKSDTIVFALCCLME